MNKLLGFVLGWSLLVAPAGWAKMDLVTLPARDRVQLTIYNAADLTLVRDHRTLTLGQGVNRLQFSWANTLIDPTSLELLPRRDAGGVAVHELAFPPRTAGVGVWNVAAEQGGGVPVEISYFTSGITWSAYYVATLAADESEMSLTGYVRVNNGSGEDYQNAETRLVVGRIHLLDRIAELARRQWPHGRPGPQPMAEAEVRAVAGLQAPRAAARALLAEDAVPKQIRKEALSEYFLYSIAGTEDIADGWGKRLLSFSVPRVPVVNLYRYEEERYGTRSVRLLSFANDTAHGLGEEPIPGGMVRVFRAAPGDALTYVGGQHTRYVPIGEQVNLELGETRDVTVRVTLLETASDNFEWDRNAATDWEDITGWDERQRYRVEVRNHRDRPVRVEVRRNFPIAAWELHNEGDCGVYERVDKDTAQYTLPLQAGEERTFEYRLVLHQGTRAR